MLSSLLSYTVLTALVFMTAFFLAKEEMKEWVDEDARAARAEFEMIFEADGIDAVVEEVDRRAAVSRRSSMIYQLTNADANNGFQIKREPR